MTRKHQHAEGENKNSRGKRNKNTKRSGSTKTGYNNINKEDSCMVWTNG
jgi:hypothetical protein